MRRALIFMGLLIATPALAQSRYGSDGRDTGLDDQIGQDEPQPQPQPTATPPAQPGRVATSSVGQVGERQTREQAAPNTQPMDRIDSRIQNRVQSRIRNRIDRYYDPRANAASPFEVASDQARTAGKSRRR